MFTLTLLTDHDRFWSNLWCWILRRSALTGNYILAVVHILLATETSHCAVLALTTQCLLSGTHWQPEGLILQVRQVPGLIEAMLINMFQSIYTGEATH